MPPMTTSARWDRAALVPVAFDGSRRPELAQLPAGLPDVATLFAFMRDAELRFATLRLGLEERTWVAAGEVTRRHDLLLHHPGSARLTVTNPAGDVTRNHEVWLSDGETIRTYRAAHRLGTSRPVRRRLAGLETDRDLPGSARAYLPVTALPANSLVDTFVHPAGFCQNVLATGTCRIVGPDVVVGREAIVLACGRPRTIEMAGDRPDHSLTVAVDRETGLIVRLVERFGDVPSRVVEATTLEPDASIPESAFVVRVPADASAIY